MDAQPEPYLTASEVAARVGGVTPETIREWSRTGVLRGYRPGGKTWLYRWSEVTEDIAASLHGLPAEHEQERPRGSRLAVVDHTPSPDQWPPMREAVRRQTGAASSAAGRARGAGKKKAALSSH